MNWVKIAAQEFNFNLKEDLAWRLSTILIEITNSLKLNLNKCELIIMSWLPDDSQDKFISENRKGGLQTLDRQRSMRIGNNVR